MRRDWSAAAEKAEAEGGICRYCGKSPVQLAHLWHRGMGGSMEADGIIPLCPKHHSEFDRHCLDILSILHPEEQVELVRQAGGIERARQRVLPSEYRKT